MKRITLIFAILLISFSLFSAENEVYRSDQLITLQEDTPFTDAVRALEQLSQKFEGKKIVNLCSYTEPIRIPIRQVYWKECVITNHRIQ